MSHETPLDASIAESLETTPALMPYMPELLADLWALGADPKMVVRLLRPLLPAHGCALDLACGKGAVSVALASALGCSVLGVDGMPAFIRAAQAQAEAHGVSHLCRFEVGDIRDFDAPEQFDVVILGATGPVLGTLRETVGRLRRMVKPGGYIVLDDAWRVDTDRPLPALAATYPEREEALAALTAHGDAIEVEEIIPVEALRRENDLNNARIQGRVDALADRHPHCAALFCSYASRQMFECYLLEHVYQCALWVVKTKNLQDQEKAIGN